MKNNYQFPRGSDWRKWDLHVHTPASALAHSFGDNWDAYVEALIEAIRKHGISAIATADYFTIEGYRNLLTYYDVSTRTLSTRDKSKSAEVAIIPGVELRLNIFNSDKDSINLHVFFNAELCSIDFINSHFLEELKVSYRGKEYSLKKQALLAIGKSITTGTDAVVGQDFSGTPDDEKKELTKKALKAVTLSKRDINDALKEIDETFESQKLPPKAYLVAVVGKGHGGISSLKWFEDNKEFSRAGLIREDITHQADIIFSNDPKDRDFYLGKHKSTPEDEIKQRFDNLKPCVWGSDSHDLEHLLHPSNGNSLDYTWIKADVTFEGLKQIVFEPELRVVIQKDNPAEAETYAKIEKFTINLADDLKIQDKESSESIHFCLRGKYEIEFSNNLTCIIGGRGSGKSTLAHILYNSWTYKDAAKLFELNSPLTNLRLSKDPLGKVRELTAVDIPANSEFFLQNEIEKFAKDIEQMSMLVRHRLERISSLDEDEKSLQELKDQWSVASVSMDELINAYDEVTSANASIKLLNKEIATLKKQTEVIKSKEYKKLQKEIEEIASSISGFASYEKEYARITGELSSLLKNIQKLDWAKYGSQDVLNIIKSDLENHRKEIVRVFAGTRVKFDENEYPKKLVEKKAELKKYLTDKGMSPENIGELADAAQQVANLEGQIQSLRDEAAPFEEIYGRKDEVMGNYRMQYDDYHSRFFAVSAQLQKNLAGLQFTGRQMEITFHPRTNEQPLRDAVANYVKANNISKAVLSADNIQAVLFDHGIPASDLVADKQKILDAVVDSQRATIHTQVLQELLSSDVFLEKLHLRIHKHYFDIGNIQVQTKLGEKFLQNTSFGERCGIVIAIVLVAGTNPIVIDQPEDNLDGRFISEVLVPLIRKQKQNRQIILITRDANIAVGGDSELIAILEDDNGRTKVLPSTIESKKARSKYIWILDGGEKAFQTREAKYNLT